MAGKKVEIGRTNEEMEQVLIYFYCFGCFLRSDFLTFAGAGCVNAALPKFPTFVLRVFVPGKLGSIVFLSHRRIRIVHFRS